MSVVADVLADAIAARAADRVFVFPGSGTNLDVIEALADRGVGVVLARSEGGAAFMASAYADLTGKPVAMLVGLGPGTANVVNGIAHALLDQSAVLLIGDRFSAAELETTGHQVLDQRALLAPVTKWHETLTAANAAAVVERALTLAAEPPAGPVYLEFPRDADGDAAPTDEVPNVAARHEQLPADAVSALAAARRPVLLVGDEAASCPQTELVALAERLSTPVLCSYKGKGVFPEDHDHWCGIVSNAVIEGELLAAADLLLAVGLDPIELLPRPWHASAPVLALRAHREPAPGYRPRWTATGDVAALVGQLAASFDAGASEWSAAEIAQRRQALLAGLRIPAPGSLSAVEVVESVLAEAPPQTTVTVDAGAHMFAATWFWRSTQPRRFLISDGLATMGYAVPAAIAAALARPDEAVIAFTGDGGFLLHGMELETAARLGARVIVVILNDASLSLIRIKQEDRRFRRLGVDFSPARLADIGRALGAEGAHVSDADGLRAAVRDALARPASTVIEVDLTGAEYRELQHAIRGGGT